MRKRLLPFLICGAAVILAAGCGGSDSRDSRDTYAACEPAAPASYRYAVDTILDPTLASRADSNVQEAFDATVNKRPIVGAKPSEQVSTDADRWIVLRAGDDSVIFGGLDSSGQVVQWFNALRKDGDWVRARLSDCEMRRETNTSRSGPIFRAATSGTRSADSSLDLEIEKPSSGCDYKRPRFEIAESSTSVTVTTWFDERNTGEDVVCVGPHLVHDTVKERVRMSEPLGERTLYDGSLVPARRVSVRD